MLDQLKRCDEMKIKALMINRSVDMPVEDRQGLYFFTFNDLP